MTSPPTNSNVPSLERIGYSAQDAFILPGTLRENILFGREYEEEFYQQTIKACALEVDFSNMQSGDRTRVTDARTLSGGQKQRIVSSLGTEPRSNGLTFSTSVLPELSTLELR